MCGCADYHVCDTHTDTIMQGLADARDLADAGTPDNAGDRLARLRAGHGRKVDEVLHRINMGALNLRAYGKR